MTNTNIVTSLSLVATLTLSGTAFAASTAFEDPATASWGGWTHGTPGTAYAQWEEFGDTDGMANDFSADAGFSGAAIAHHISNNAGAFVTGGGLGGNIYSFSDTPDFTTYIQPFTVIPGAEGITVALQISSSGTELDLGSVSLSNSGVGGTFTSSYDSVSTIFTADAGGAFGGEITEYLFLWNLDSDIGFYQFDYSATGAHLSLDAVSIDIGPALASTAVPIPAAFPLLGSAVIGLLGFMRRK